VLTISEVMQDPHLIARDFVGFDDHPVVGPRPIPAVAWQYDGRRSALPHAPLLGEGTEEIIEGLCDRGRAEIAALRERQILW
jgi:crotonobetainyl-CoA:carnitine CoA-transferase CaiB-like acyl-CoA transferase